MLLKCPRQLLVPNMGADSEIFDVGIESISL
jgi:hypothetical protein